MASRAFEIHATGLGFPEGPVALPEGTIAFVDLLHGKIRAWKEGETREIATLPGAPNGMCLGPDGMLYVANNGGIAPRSLEELNYAEPQISGCIQRVGLDGLWQTFAGNLPGPAPNRPNDLVFSPEGDLIFTDPQNWEVLGSDDAAYKGGQLLAADRDGTVRRLAAMTGFPNGLAFHPDGSLLVGLTIEHRIVRLPWKDGEVGPMEEWLRLDDSFAPDGMVFHEDRLWLTGSSGDRIAVCDLGGNVVEMIDTGPGSDCTNLCIAEGRVWVTLGIPGQLISFPL